jgi:hypothetical protein
MDIGRESKKLREGFRCLRGPKVSETPNKSRDRPHLEFNTWPVLRQESLVVGPVFPIDPELILVPATPKHRHEIRYVFVTIRNTSDIGSGFEDALYS